MGRKGKKLKKLFRQRLGGGEKRRGTLKEKENFNQYIKKIEPSKEVKERRGGGGLVTPSAKGPIWMGFTFYSGCGS